MERKITVVTVRRIIRSRRKSVTVLKDVETLTSGLGPGTTEVVPFLVNGTLGRTVRRDVVDWKGSLEEALTTVGR